MEQKSKNQLYVNYGEEDQMEIVPYRINKCKVYLTYIGYFLTCGVVRLVLYWLPYLMLWATHSKCSLAKAEKILLVDKFHSRHVVTVQTMTREGTGVKIKKPKKAIFKKHEINLKPENDNTLIRFFVCKRVKYIWNSELSTYIPLKGLDEGYRQSYFHNTEGLTSLEQSKRHVLYGRNSIAVHVTPIMILLVREVFSPFYIFQLFSMCLWYAEDYWIYATCIFVMTTLSIILQIYQTRKFERALRNTVSSTNINTVLRSDGSYEDIASEELVPGDVIEIPRFGCDMQCDAVLITGNCIVNESMLTGESVPVTKTPLPNTTGMKSENDPEVTIKTHSRHILFCGTHVIQTRFYGNQKVKAVVLRTGFSTSKGELVRSIMYPKPVDFKFQRHSYYYVMFLSFIAILGFIYTVILMVQNEELVSDIILRALDLITIAIPPALPAALAVGIVFSQRRLKVKDVYCISPRGINVCGTINAVCFDKTGTLTEDGLDMHGVVEVKNSKFSPILRDTTHLHNGDLLFGMACCHSLTIIDNEIIGDPMDLIMFNATNWILEEPGPDETRFDMMIPTIVRPSTQHKGSLDILNNIELGIVRQFPFSSSLQRMSVVTRRLGAKNFDLYVKGSPEMITSLSKPETIPQNFHQVLQSYTQHGYRVIALASKQLSSKLNYVKVQRINREQVEHNLTFLGLLVMENRLKPQSAPVICELNDADIRTIMVTGDNMLTALSVARECKMVDLGERIILVQAYPPQAGQSEVSLEFVYADDANTKVEQAFTLQEHKIQMIEDHQRFHFALTGKTWAVIRQYRPDLLEKIVVKGTVFARMGPDQKGQLVQVLQDVGYYVGMCGDGANDCGALKTAHMGISLSEAEASVASPFTSKTPNIECVPNVIKEGRAALVTSFGVFKYMACYSLTQFISVLILYWIDANLTDPEFLYVDFFLITTFSISFSQTGPYDELVVDRPLVSLLSPSPILSILTQMTYVTAFQTFMYFYVQAQPWFIPFVDNDEEDYNCQENAAVFLISAYQYITLAVVFAKGAPFRKSIFSNWWLILNLIVAIGATAWINIYPTENFADLLELNVLPSIKYRSFIIGLAFIQFVLAYITEKFLIDNESLRRKLSSCLKGCSQDLAYHKIESDIEGDPNWPPVSDKQVDLAEMFQRLESLHQGSQNIEELKSSLEDILDQEEEEESNEKIDKTQLRYKSSSDLEELHGKNRHGTENKAFIDSETGYNTML
ncbi:polyamine-transporting ATPase 13A3-like [Biomphalaria glabrata]|uniref:Cation-transporting ATPase n=2 Tax=Biomphalaria glabrata TaxID=6526 RepID=A0A9W2YP52_BIOGL|nr:polyamine-transporting ATPase 13A3-like [Biomphalaria glabrata]XP_055864483.1 polyamine-transporting ATPase 13A3-like [Biomphalaria glabrata]XP_055864484.1 polyamine-transporting ATPase 13A3-like [Biomphalaria glabrata]KAI8736275.1 putative cation-transporting ATPase 13A3 [Biomphalaria glabrata]